MNRTLRESDGGKDKRGVAHPQSTSELNRARVELADTLRTILRRDGENELIRLVLDICEAGELQPYEHKGIRCWQPASDCRFASRLFGFENQTRAATASLFFDRLTVFSVEVGTRLEIRWIAREMGLRPN
jgi:hypothetical protein